MHGVVGPRKWLVQPELTMARVLGTNVIWDARIDDPFGRPIRMPLDVEDLLVHGVVRPRKWLVQPESTMARVLGTNVRGVVVFANFPL